MKTVVLLAAAGVSAALAQPFTLDTDFPNGSGADDFVRSVAVQPDGRIVVAGDFTNVHGAFRPGVARLLADGRLDDSFQPTITNAVRRVAVAPDGSVLLSGYYADPTQSKPGVAKLRVDGAFDGTFALPHCAPANAAIDSLDAGAGGRLWLRGSFTNVSGVTARQLVRLNADGSLDPSFTSPFTPGQSLHAILSLPDGKVLVAGSFTNLGGLPGFGLARLNSDGSVDGQFQSPLGSTNGLSRLALLSDGRVLALWSGGFDYGPLPRGLVRLLPGGGLDVSYRPDLEYPARLAISGIASFCPQPDGSAMVLGYFREANGVPRPGLVRLLPDGSTDLCFEVGLGVQGLVLAADTAPDGGMILGGTFTDVEGQPRGGLARLRPPRACEPAVIEFGASAALVSEDGGQAILSAIRRGGADRQHSVRYESESGTGTSGSDFTGVSGTLVFAPGARSVSFAVPILRDKELEQDETFVVRLSDPSDGASLGAGTQAEITIADHQPGGAAGLADASYVPDVPWPVESMLLLDDATLLVGQGGYAAGSTTGLVQRLQADGTPVPGFAPVTCDDNILALAQLDDGRWLAGGAFVKVNGREVPAMARFDDRGQIDESFHPFAGIHGDPAAPTSAWIEDMLPLPDGSVLAAGSFRLPGDIAQDRAVVRVTASGQIDPGYAQGLRRGASAYTVVSCPAGGHWIGVYDMMFGVWRLFEDGAADPRFVPPAALLSSAACLAVEPGGSVLAGGIEGWSFMSENRTALVRLNADGSLACDLGRKARLPASTSLIPPIRALVALPDGKLLVGGSLSQIGNLPGRALARLHQDGGMDYSFDAGPVIHRGETNGTVTTEMPAEVRAIVPMPGGGWLVGGDFAGFGNLRQRHLVRLLEERPGETPAVELVVETDRVDEGAGQVVGRILRRGDATQPASVRVLTRALEAKPGADFEPVDAIFELAAGEWAKEFAVRLIDDTAVGLNVSFELTLANPSPGLTILEPAGRIILILEDDVNVEFADTVFRGSEDEGNAAIPMIRYGVPGDALVVRCRAEESSVVMTIPAMHDGGTRTNIVRMPVADDAAAQGDWTLGLQLEIVSGAAALGPRHQATLVVADNDYSLAPAQGVAGVVNALAPAEGGGAYIAGDFTGVHGVPRRSVARVFQDNAVDPAFDPGEGPDAAVTLLAVQPDGRLLIAGDFTNVAGKPRTGLARLSSTGALDETFDAGPGPAWLGTGSGDGAAKVLTLGVQPDGRVLVGGRFTHFSHEPALCLTRLEPDGRPDRTLHSPFVPGSGETSGVWPPPVGISSVVRTLVLQADGRIIVGGLVSFTMPGLPIPATFRVARLLADGAVDPDFLPVTAEPLRGSTAVSAVQGPDGKLWLGSGISSRLPPRPQTNWLALERFEADGRPDASFQLRGVPELPVVQAAVRQVHALADGSSLVLVDCTLGAAGLDRFSRVVRVLPDGTWDAAFGTILATDSSGFARPGIPSLAEFRPEITGSVLSDAGAIRCVLPGEASLTVGGAFSEIAGEPRRRLARFSLEGTIWGRFEWMSRLDGSFFEARIPADVPWPYAIEFSPDLSLWFPVGMHTPPWLPFNLRFPSSAPRLYLRAVQLP